MSIQPLAIQRLRQLPIRVLRVLDPAANWLRRELDAARRDTLDDQFMATTRGNAYRRPERLPH
ncbi:hypothetical protein [Rhodovibrio salinarum]|uniref:Uncharacterized protein n=1 Tax=Rhodovibrio salinarum TaxID=1087 RepID=A0A934V148_9PROT|nr:hypothetical protein [Rhodovibrio salinarum]MBK1699072.1 hypothetical protein [Rhodovibrio salinarum]